MALKTILFTDSIQEKQKKRKPKIFWYTPPFSAIVKTNIGKIEKVEKG